LTIGSDFVGHDRVQHFVIKNVTEEPRWHERLVEKWINPDHDQPFVPPWFLRYILYHEMLHAVVPDEAGPNGRRCVHTEKFYERERKFPRYRSARKWEEDNLARFLR